MKNMQGGDYYDVGYAVVSVSLTSTGLVAIATTGAFYHGISMVADTTKMSIVLYDSISATAGNIIDVISINAGGQIMADKFNPTVARKGITAGIVGTGGKGVVFFGPKG